MRRLAHGALTHEAAHGGRGRVLLSTHAEHLLWEQVIARQTEDLPRRLLDVPALAATAAEAWKRICLWGEPSWNEPVTEDVEAFREWLPRFRARIEAEGFVTGGELAGVVADAIRGDALDEPLPARAVTVSFERATPQLMKLAEALRSRGVEVTSELDGDSRPAAVPVALRMSSPAAELRTVASRIRAILAARPAARIGVLAPDPGSYGSRLERVFEEELDPEAVVTPGATSRRRFDLAEAPMLADYSIVSSALDLLSLTERRNHFEVVSRILLSEFPRESGADGKDDPAASERDRILRGAVEAALRRERSASLRLSGKESLSTALREGKLGARADSVEKLAATLERDVGARRSPSAWRREWIDRLKTVRWPGPLRGVVEPRVFQRWRDAMDEFAMLEVVQPTMDAADAQRRLREICKSMPVQPPSERHSVQVVNFLDAAGFDFDVIFAIGMTATAFPPPPRPNALLPVRWQRAQAGLPRASVEAERELAETVWARVRASAPEIVATFPAVGDGREENVASACLADLPVVDANPREGRPWWLDAERTTPEARPPDEPVRPLVRRGGSSILRHQSDCAFRAFSAVRLGAEKLDTIRPQPDASRRGTLVHSALSHAYRAIPSSVDLAGQSDENIGEIARDAAARAVADAATFFEDADDLAASAREWLADLVAAWMRHERDERVEAWEVDSIEHDFEAQFPAGAGDSIAFKFRPDRIDRVDGGAVVILDFKTSSTAKTGSVWNGERPAEPQLPLYLALVRSLGPDVEGIAFGNLSARDTCELVGAGAREFAPRFLPPSRKKIRTAADFDAAVEGWLVAVEGLAQAYLRGEMQVDPRKRSVCGHCGATAFCRIRELGGAADEEESGEADE